MMDELLLDISLFLAMLFFATLPFTVPMVRGLRRPKLPPVLRGFTTLPQATLEVRGWRTGLSPGTMAKLLMWQSLGPADHLPLQQERDRYWEVRYDGF